MPTYNVSGIRKSPIVAGTILCIAFAGSIVPFIIYICHLEYEAMHQPTSWSSFLTLVTDLDCCMEASSLRNEKKPRIFDESLLESVYVQIPSNEKLLTEFIDKNLDLGSEGVLVAQGEIRLGEVMADTDYGDELITLKFEIPRGDEFQDSTCLHILGPKKLYNEMVGSRPTTNCSSIRTNNYTLLDMKLRSANFENPDGWCENSKRELTFSIHCFDDAYFTPDDEVDKFDTYFVVLSSMAMAIMAIVAICTMLRSMVNTCIERSNRTDSHNNPGPIVMLTMEDI